MKIGFISALVVSLSLAACTAPSPREPLKGHLNTDTPAPVAKTGSIPAPVQQTLALPKPQAARKAETYSVVVNNVPVSDLLFALARDAKVNVDIHPGITGTVTLNAIDYLTKEEVRALLAAPDCRTPAGLRDRAMLHLAYAAGLRASELLAVRMDDFPRGSFANIRVLGKGRRERVLHTKEQKQAREGR